MKTHYIVLSWILICIIYIVFGIDSNKFWDCVFYSKDALCFVLLINYAIKNFINTRDIKMLRVFMYSEILIIAVQNLKILDVLNNTRCIHVTIYALSLLIILIIIGYDRKNKR